MKFNEWIPEYLDVVSERVKNGQSLSFLKQEEELLQDYLKGGAKILDIGCATGYAFYNFKNYDVKYFGVDIVEEYILEGRNELKNFGLNPENLSVASIYDLPSDKLFEITLCNTMIQHLDEYEKAFEIIAKNTSQISLIRTLTSDETIIRKTKKHDDTTKEWKNEVDDSEGIAFNVYKLADLKKSLLKYFSSVETISDQYTEANKVQIFENDHFSYTIFKCLK